MFCYLKLHCIYFSVTKNRNSFQLPEFLPMNTFWYRVCSVYVSVISNAQICDKYWIFFTIGHFYSLPCVADFLLDVLTGCCRDEVRTCAANSLHKLSAIQTQPAIERPKYYLLRVVLAARLPYWVSSSSTRGTRQVCNTIIVIRIYDMIEVQYFF